jgi:hypothetical protein
MNFNVLKMRLPASMSPVYGSIKVRITLSDLPVPPSGFFPTRLVAQLTRGSDDLRPHALVSSGDYIYSMAKDGYTVGMFLAREGNGSPYACDVNNVLYVKLWLSASLAGGGSILPSASLSIQAPNGYTCQSAGNAEYNLQTLSSRVPQGRGSLVSIQNWRSASSSCVFDLTGYDFVYSNSALVLRLVVNNPPQPLSQSDPANRWRVILRSKGLNTQAGVPYSFPSSPFSNSVVGAVMNTDYASTVAVLGKLSSLVIQPGDYSASTSVNAKVHFVSIWFKTAQDTSPSASSSFVLIAAPTGFEFNSGCVVRDLPQQYYSSYYYTSSSSIARIWPLAAVLKCTGLTGDNQIAVPPLVSSVGLKERNFALISLNSKLFANRKYGLQLQVLNPTVNKLNMLGVSSSSLMRWSVWTLDRDQTFIDG